MLYRSAVNAARDLICHAGDKIRAVGDLFLLNILNPSLCVQGMVVPSSIATTYLAIAAVAEDDADGAKRAVDMSHWSPGSTLSLAEAGVRLVSHADSGTPANCKGLGYDQVPSTDVELR